MPRSRDNGSPARDRPRSPELDEMMVAYVSGVSQRKMGDVTEALMGERVGRSTVSRVAVDEAVDRGASPLSVPGRPFDWARSCAPQWARDGSWPSR